MFATKKAKNKCVCNKKRLQKVNIFRKSLCLQKQNMFAKNKCICKNVILVKFNELLYSTLTKHHNIHTNRKQF